MTYLLTWFGTLVCRERSGGGLVHRPFTGSFDDVDVLYIGELDGELRIDFDRYMLDDSGDLRVAPDSGPLAGWEITRASDHLSLILSRDNLALTADAEGGAVRLAAGDPGPSGRFLAIVSDDLLALRDILAGQWLVGSAETSASPVNAAMAPGFELRIGTLTIDLRWNLPFDRSEWPHRLTVLSDAWRINRIFRYRPLIYYAVFSSEGILRQFALSVASLRSYGDYDGTVVVLTDKTAAEILERVPAGMRANTVVLTVGARDRVAYMGARLTIDRWPEASRFQPLMYVDTDIIFDTPVAPMLHAIAQSNRMSAVAEPDGRLDTAYAVGCGLLRIDGCTPGDRLGFNFGTLGIPNLRQHASTLALMGRVLQNHAMLCGREALPFADQAVANYVAYRMDAVDIALISPYMRLSDHRIDTTRRSGMVHYCWVPGSDAKAAAMQEYLRQLALSSPGKA